MSQSKNQKTQEQMLKEIDLLRKASVAVAAVIVVVALLCVWNFVVPHSGNVNGVYGCSVMDNGSFDMKLTFDAGAHSYAETVSEETAGSGSYTVRGSKLITKNENGTKKAYAVYEDGDVILPEDYIYDGDTIADGDTFEAKASRTGIDSAETIMEFFADGTYTCTVIQRASDASTDNTVVSHGTYTREGDVIRRVLINEDGEEKSVPSLFVYEGKLCNYCFRR